ncbi:MAG: leucyl/phenylalanyl-tRNA--protein transferase [Balneolales bacterium]
MSIISPHQLLEGYIRGIFPMADSRDDKEVQWYTARLRGIIPLENFRVSKKVKRLSRQKRFTAAINKDFRGVMEACAERESTWISQTIIDSFAHLHTLGYAHSVEIYENDRLAGGLYGVAIGGAFFAESMFQRTKEASKIALCHCHQHLVKQGFELWDVQFYTDHLGQFGCIQITDKEYEIHLENALKKKAVFDDRMNADAQ